MRKTALSPLLVFTKKGFHKWILTCYILELQREPLRAESLLLENRGVMTSPALASFMKTLLDSMSSDLDGFSWWLACTELLVFTCKKRGFSVKVCACHTCACLEVCLAP